MSRRVCGFRLGQGLGSSRTRGLGGSTPFLNPHIAWYRKSNPVTGYQAKLVAPTIEHGERLALTVGHAVSLGSSDHCGTSGVPRVSMDSSRPV